MNDHIGKFNICPYRIIPLMWMFLTLTGSLGSSMFAQSNSAATQNNSVRDLRSSFTDESETILLDHKWMFYWDQLVFPGESGSGYLRDLLLLWNEDPGESFGFATYRTQLLLPEDHQPLSLFLPDFYSSYRLFANGKLIAENGKVGTSKEKYEPHWLPAVVPLDINDTLVTLTLQVANFDHSKGGAYAAPSIGPTEDMIRHLNLRYGYAFILTGALVMGGLFFLGLFSFGRHDKTIFFFSIFCLTYSYRIIGFGDYPLHFLLPDLPWIFTLKLEYITLFLSGFLFGEYTLRLYPEESSRIAIRILSGLSLMLTLTALIMPAKIFTMFVVPYFIVLIIYIFYAVYIYVQASLNNRQGAGFALGSTGILFIVFIYEILVYFGYAETLLILNLLGYLGFFFLQSLVLSFRFAQSLKDAKIQAEAASIAKSQFLSTMSHEIRTPLNAVIGLSGLLSESDLNQQQQDFSDTIKKSGESLLSIINNILDYSKIESERLELESVEFELREIVETALDLSSSSHGKPGVEVIYYINEDVPPYLIGDSIRLQQVIMNLVSNALKFTKEGEVTLLIAQKRQTSDEVELQCSVEDTGIGIPADKMGRLFQSFSQVDASSTRKYGGTGLGLVITKKLVESMNGSIKVESEEGKGTTFHFNVVAGRSTREFGDSTRAQLDGKYAFILDDHAINLDLLENQLKKSGMTVDRFEDPSDIMANIYKLKKYDLGIVDMQMPEYDGVQVAQAIRLQWDEEQLPLVLLSSIHELNDEDALSHFNIYLKKPVKLQKLLNNLERLFPADEVPRKTVSSETWTTGSLRVLVAEDNEVNQRVATQILKKLGHDAVIAVDGKEALEKMQNEAFDLIFMDMEMPVMDGIESTRQIRKFEATSSSSKARLIIAMTANAMADDKTRCLEAGMNDFIAKPVTVETIRKIIRKWSFYH